MPVTGAPCAQVLSRAAVQLVTWGGGLISAGFARVSHVVFFPRGGKHTCIVCIVLAAKKCRVSAKSTRLKAEMGAKSESRFYSLPSESSSPIQE